MLPATGFRPDVVHFPAYPDEQRIAPRRWRYEQPYEYVWELHDRLHRIRAPAGWEYDGASVPRLLRLVVDPDLLHKVSGIHDLGYHYRGAFPRGVHQVLIDGYGWRDALTLPSGIRVRWSRRDLDRLMVAMLREDVVDGPTPRVRRLTYRGLRVGGWYRWMQAGQERAA